MNRGPIGPPATEDFQGLHVLLVDDDPAFLDLIHAMLTSIGVDKVTRAQSGREAFKSILSTQRVIDVILCDQNMAEGTGLELLWVVRTGQAKSFRPDACFLLVTAAGDHQTVGVAARLDVSGFLVKPVTPGKLATAILQARKRSIKIDLNRYKLVQLPPA